MTLKTNSAEGGTAGTGVTAGNSGGASGTAFDTVSPGAAAGGTITYSTAHVAHGALAIASTPGTAAICYLLMADTVNSSAFSVRFYMYLTGYPSAETAWVTLQTTAGGNVVGVNLTATGKLALQNANPTTLGTTTNSVPLNTWVRVTLYGTCDPTAGSVTLAMYPGDSTTATETLSYTSNTGTTGSTLRCIYGKFTASPSMATYYFDDIRQDLTVNTEMSAVGTSAAHAGGNQTVAVGSTVTLSGVDSTGSGLTYAWAQTSPATPAVTLSGSGATRTFTAPSVGTTTSFTFTLTTTDGAGLTSTDTAVVTVYPNGSFATYTVPVTATGWAVTGASAQAALSDGSEATYLTSPTAPAGALIDGTLSALTKPSSGFTVQVKCKKIGAATGTFVATLYEGTTQRAQVTGIAIPDYLGWIDVTFPSSSLVGVADSAWGAGLRLTLAATAS